jgi:glucan 1,3-beta-glucosidase
MNRYGTAAEHNVLYQYQLQNTKNVFMAMIQTETPYFQSNPDATVPFPINSAWNDPTYASCTTASCRKSWALRVVSSSDIVVYGAGLYSFFENYAQECITPQTCQAAIVNIESSSKFSLLNLNTVAAVSMVNVNGGAVVPASGNENSFTRTLLRFDAL